MSEVQAPPATLPVTFRGEPRELKMSFLRLNTCLRIVGNMENMPALMIDPDMGEHIVRALVAEKGGAGNLFDVELGDDDLSAADYDKIVDFARDHLTYFFVRRLQSATANSASLESMIEALRSSVAGSEA